MTNLELYVEKLIETKTVEHIAISVGKGDAVLFETYRSGGKKIDDKTLFDMASVTKILSVTPIALIALDNKLISLEEKVSDFFDYNIIDDYKNLKIINLLTHTMGIGHENLTKENVTYDNAAEYILNIPAEIKRAKLIDSDCDRIINEAREKAEAIIQDAETRASRMISEQAILQEAKKRALDMLTKAQNGSNDIKDAAEKYVNRLLDEAQDYFRNNLQEVQQTKDKINSVKK